MDSSIVTWVIQTIIMVGIGVIGYFIKSTNGKLDERMKDNENKLDALEEKFNNFKEEIPQKYVGKDDFIRAISSIGVKLDKIYDYITLKKGGQQ